LLADAVERILNGPRNAERMALAGSEKVRRDFNLHHIAQQLEGIFAQMLKGRVVGVGAGTRREEPVGREVVVEGRVS
jgi:hypothetical protein